MLVKAKKGQRRRLGAMPLVVAYHRPRRRGGGHFFSCLRVYGSALLLFWKDLRNRRVSNQWPPRFDQFVTSACSGSFCCSPSARVPYGV